MLVKNKILNLSHNKNTNKKMGKIIKLIFVEGIGKNSNKFYNMSENSDGTFSVEYGRVDSTSQKTSYPMSQWSKKYNEKLKKGYKDITELYKIEDDNLNESKEKFISNDTYVRQLIEDLQRWASNTVKENYKVSSKNVTSKMVEEAQHIMDKISNLYQTKYTTTDLNKLLLELFKVIPRKMGNVADYLASENADKEEVSKIIDKEQSILDTLAGQVSLQEKEVENKSENKGETTNLLDQMGVEVKHVTDEKTIQMVKKLMGESSSLFNRLFEVRNFKTEKRYDDYLAKMKVKNEELFFHGSRNQNWLSIGLQSGLLIRPSGAIVTGGMFGSQGIYFADKCRKSVGYTSLSGSYWARGNDNKAYLGLFRVNLGNQKHIYKHDYSCYNLNKNNIKPYDSVYAHGGSDLINSEYIIYDINQSDIRYLIEIKK